MVSSFTTSGDLTWRKDVTKSAIIDMACSDDCTSIVLGSQDGNVWNLNKQGEHAGSTLQVMDTWSGGFPRWLRYCCRGP